jgi:hypothetical protein
MGRYSVCDPAKVFFTSKFSYFLSCNPTHEIETMTANRWGTTKSKPPGPIAMMGQSDTEQKSDHIYYTLFCRCWTGIVPFASDYKKTVQLFGAKTIFVSQLAHFDFSSCNFNVQGPIVSTIGDALTMWTELWVCMEQHKCHLISVQGIEGYVFACFVSWTVFTLALHTLCTHSLSVGHPPNVWGSLVNNVLLIEHSSVVALYFGGSLTPSTQPH